VKINLILFINLVFSLLACNTKKETIQNSPTNNREISIVEKYWKLIELNGQKIDYLAAQGREAHFVLEQDNNRVVGNGGCNNFGGNYQILAGNRIQFSDLFSTKMACANMEIEYQFINALEAADNYTFTTTGDTLSLNKARMAPLARFVFLDRRGR
jgi:heat shock protein HslJ